MIEELKAYTKGDALDMDRLMHELSATSACNEKILDAIVNDRNSHLYVLRMNEHIVGCACLCLAHTPEATLGFIESVTVLSDYRGKGYGRMLMAHLIAEAKDLGVQKLHLTSKPKRIAANGLYQALGFRKYDTNCYVMEMQESQLPMALNDH